MEIFDKFCKKSILGFKIYIILVIIFIGVIFGFSYFLLRFFNSNFKSSNPISIPLGAENKSDPVAPETNDVFIPGNEIKMLYLSKENGRIWSSKWENGGERMLKSGQKDPFDPEFIVRGNGTISINGRGVAQLQGDAPRMYVYDPAKNKKWNNVEVTVYAKRVSETGVLSSQGIIIGARSEHQDATLQNPCLGATYYGRLLYDGRAVFQKEVIHEGSYSKNKPAENNKVQWDTSDGTMPIDVWIGVKFILKTNPDGKSVKLELYRDLTDGKNGGTWEKIAEYTDSGDWAQTNSGADVEKICGYPSSEVILKPGTSVFIRNDKISDMEYKLFSIREIE